MTTSVLPESQCPQTGLTRGTGGPVAGVAGRIQRVTTEELQGLWVFAVPVVLLGVGGSPGSLWWGEGSGALP